MADEKKQEQKVEQPPVVEEKKKKSKVLLYVIIGIFVFLIVIGVAAFLFVRGLINRATDVYDEADTIIEQFDDIEIDTDSEEDGEETWRLKMPTEESVDGDLEKDNLVNREFPSDIPLSGGIVTASSFSADYSVEVSIDVNSTVEEVLDWYEQALEEEGWVITGRSSQESMEGWISGRIDFESEDGERTGRINIDTNPFQDYTSITVREYLY